VGSVNFVYFCKSDVSAVQDRKVTHTKSTTSKVIEFGTNRKRVCDFLLVRNSNLGSILHRIGDFARFVLLIPPLFHPNFGVFLLDQIAHVGVNVSRDLKLFGREITFEVFQPM